MHSIWAACSHRRAPCWPSRSCIAGRRDPVHTDGPALPERTDWCGHLTTWTILQHDGPDHIGLLCNARPPPPPPGQQRALFTSDCASTVAKFLVEQSKVFPLFCHCRPSSLETLPFVAVCPSRCLRQCLVFAVCLSVAEFLVTDPAMQAAVEWVSYAGLPDSKYHGLAKKYTPKGAGAVFTVGLKGGYEAGARPSQHGLSSKKMTLVTSDCGATRYLSIRWP